MSKAKSILISILMYCKTHWFIIFTVITYLFFTVYYVGANQTIFDCSNTLNGLGDSTAGPVWRAANTDDTFPIGGYSHATNYPTGESLSTPVDAVIVGQSVIMWATAKLAGPVCGYNLATALGFFSTAMVMFSFVYTFTKKRKWIALMAGYAVAFTPFFQIKSSGHPSYGFEGLLIGALWAFLSLLKTGKMSRAILFAVLAAFCFYFDPYYSLMLLTIIVPIGLVWLFFVWRSSRNRRLPKIKLPLKTLLCSGLLFAVLVAPIGYVMTSQSAEIKAVTSGTRDDVIKEAKAYSNVPSEYLLPYEGSFLLNIFGTFKADVMKSWYAFSMSNLSEDTVGVSLVMVIVVTLFFVIICWEKLQKKRLRLHDLFSYDSRILIFGGLAIVIAAVLIALPPVHVLGIPLPSYILLKLVNIWRILSREYVIVNIGMVILFVVSLMYFIKTLKLSKLMQSILYGIFFFLIFIQYQAFTPFDGVTGAKFRYSDSPVGYSWLKDQSDIKAIAEYPIEKATLSNAHGFYLSMQYIHKKPLLNSNLNNSPQDPIRAAIKNLADPQSVPTLHALGINAVVVHGVDPEDIAKVPYLNVVYVGKHGGAQPGGMADPKDIMVIARISDDTPRPTSSTQFIGTPLVDSEVQRSSVDWQYVVASGEVIKQAKLPLEKSVESASSRVCFEAKMRKQGDVADLLINRTKVAELTNDYQSIQLDTVIDKELKLTTSNGQLMNLTKIGCN